MSKNFTISLFADNQQLVLQRIVIICGRKRVYIESLSVSEVEDKKLAHYTLRVRSQRTPLEKVVKQLERIVEVHGVSVLDIEVSDFEENASIFQAKKNGSAAYATAQQIS